MGIAEETPNGIRNLGNQVPTAPRNPVDNGRPTGGDYYQTPGAPGGGNSGTGNPNPGLGGGDYTTPVTTGINPAAPAKSPVTGGPIPTATPGVVKKDTSIVNLVNTWANSVGLGSLSGWITTQVQELAGEGMSASDIASVIQSTINTAPGFDALMPGYNQRIKNGYTNTDAGAGSGIAGYLSYRQQINAMAETAGLVPGTITAQDIGNSWANDVSTAEMSTRLTTEYTNAINAMPQIQNELKNYGYVQGLTPGQLASYYINPDQTVNTLQQQFNSAVVGGEGTLTGFGEIGQSKAYALQAFLSNGGQNNLSAAQGASFFDSALGGGLNSLSAMANAGFETNQLGTAQGNPGVVSQDQLLAAGEGNAGAIQTVQRAAQTRSAASAGGGGVAATQTGAQGIGFGSS